MPAEKKDGTDIEELAGIGKRRAKLLRDGGYPTIESLYGATIDDLTRINGIGNKTANWILSAVKEYKGDDALKSQVLRKEEKKVSKNEKYSRQLLEWSTEGYDVSPLEKLIKDGGEDLDRMFRAYEKSIERIEEIKKDLSSLNVSRLDEYVDRIMKMIKRPSKIKQIEREYALIKKAAEIRDIDYELKKLAVPGLKERVEEVRAKLRDPSRLEEVKIDLKDLQRDYKENYFLEQITKEMAPTPPMEKKTIKEFQKKEKGGKMVVDDLFLLYKKDLKLISHHTTQKLSSEERKKLLAQLQTIRSFIKMGKSYKSGMLNIIKYRDKFIFILEGKYVIMALSAHGSIEKWAGRLMEKVIGLIEKEDEAALKNWDGDVNKITSEKKNMKALLYVSAKLSKREA